MSINRRVDQHTVVKSHHRLFHINEKEWARAAVASWMHLRHDAEWKKPDAKEWTARFHPYEVQKQSYVMTIEQWLLLGTEGRVDWEGQGQGLLGCWKCSRTWSWWWLHRAGGRKNSSGFAFRFRYCTTCALHLDDDGGDTDDGDDEEEEEDVDGGDDGDNDDKSRVWSHTGHLWQSHFKPRQSDFWLCTWPRLWIFMKRR